MNRDGSTPMQIGGPTFTVELPGLRRAGAAMLALGAVLPLLPHHPGLPCPLRSLTGVPCPLCGMTTAVERGLAGRFSASVAANPFGLVAIVVAVALVLRPPVRTLTLPLWLIAIALATSWTWELRRFGFV